MKSITLPLTVLICFVVSCGNHSTPISNSKKEATTPAAQANTAMETNQAGQDTTQWIDNFRTFRDAVYQKNKEKVKQFIDFPIMNGNNNIWYLVYGGVDEKVNSLSDSVKPFTEKDFDQYFESLFPKRFINCLLKIKSEELFKKGEVQTKEIKDGNTTYVLSATFDKSENTLSLNLNSTAPYKTDDGEIDKSEFSEIYLFTVLSNGKLKFVRVEMAG
ncbi:MULTISPECIES: hypothetical protein [Niastella]|uniref:Lipoprotein n=1 Tax=Niastella soli TaxID=2821487 RepID=A0ABS3YSP5_9BACT|nr:hypothetical protein [Niastella soli]MBO9200914.1 hypothetical protein [Niastella soli]